jgi:hypothetical protein
MTDRAHVSTTQAAHDRLDAHRREGESWSDLFERVADVLDDADANGPETVAVENVDEIARAAADEVENRMTRR